MAQPDVIYQDMEHNLGVNSVEENAPANPEFVFSGGFPVRIGALCWSNLTNTDAVAFVQAS